MGDNVNSTGNWVFFVDEGAVYDLSFYADGESFAAARRTGTVYRSWDHTLALTGRKRRQTTRDHGLGIRVDGYRAVLYLDTGEGISELRGVAV